MILPYQGISNKNGKATTGYLPLSYSLSYSCSSVFERVCFELSADIIAPYDYESINLRTRLALPVTMSGHSLIIYWELTILAEIS
jgi:hypothetical protein